MKLININLREVNLKRKKISIFKKIPAWQVTQRKLLRHAVKEFLGQERVLKLRRENKRQCFTDAE
jgi:hypothetical protein